MLFTSLDTFGKLLDIHVSSFSARSNDRVCNLFQWNSFKYSPVPPYSFHALLQPLSRAPRVVAYERVDCTVLLIKAGTKRTKRVAKAKN